MLQEAYNRILIIGYKIKHASDNAMILTHAWNYQGFKRMHELICMFSEFYCLKLKKEMRDDHELSPTAAYSLYPAYNPVDIKDHIHKWKATMLDVCKQLAEANKQLTMETGTESALMCEYLSIMKKFKQQIVRYVKRYEDNNGMVHDLYVYNDRFHDKLKKVQKKIDKTIRGLA